MKQSRKVTQLGLIMIVTIAVSGMAGFIGSWTSNTIPILLGILAMLHLIAIILNETIQVLRDIREQTRRTGQR